MPESEQFLKSHGVELAPVANLREYGAFEKTISALASLNFHACISDILRVLVLEQLGGLYADLDFKLLSSTEPLHHMADFYTGEEAFPFSLTNAFMGARRASAVLRLAMLMLKRNFRIISKDRSAEIEPLLARYEYLDLSDCAQNLMFIAGPVVITQAFVFSKMARQEQTLVIPSDFVVVRAKVEATARKGLVFRVCAQECVELRAVGFQSQPLNELARGQRAHWRAYCSESSHRRLYEVLCRNSELLSRSD